MTDIELINSHFPCKEAEVFDFGSVKVGAMRFDIKRYEVIDIGNLSIMSGTAMFGLMKMKTVIFTPLEKDAPLFSYDRILVMGNDTIFIELYNTVISEDNAEYIKQNNAFENIKASYSSIAEHELGSYWYDDIKMPYSTSKKGKRKAYSDKFDEMYAKYLKQYFSWLDNVPDCDKKLKAQADEKYVSGLIENGGASTDAFIKAIGKDKTAKLFRKVLFGTAV